MRAAESAPVPAPNGTTTVIGRSGYSAASVGPTRLQRDSRMARTAQLGDFRTVILPLSFPGVVAGSIFTFSLTLGDYIIPQLVGPPGLFIGSMVYTQQGSIGNLPMAAAFTVVPIVIVGIYLAIARRLGAFDAL